nr:MAG TPA: hypothetical protein [Caudoviricetes sp.]
MSVMMSSRLSIPRTLARLPPVDPQRFPLIYFTI